MSSVGIRELKNHLSAHLTLVKQGGELTVTEHGKPVAMLVPFPRSEAQKTLDELVALGLAIPPSNPVRVTPRPINLGIGVSDLVAEQRR
ncbi:type II toxin-antitoxin system prevent-host-death family antitoxin [Leucobacter insecticola]|uniref:Antitoxin n=1 Tax=Leucobacter insecticola TaxID=2714934 RepID=A0A6G8FG26_9MICO|nr:type II toxin-antitoxin system prevent-host-death family antitoxin [Leucobacter insecticola]QIM15466.1 type II toxin-antitoxin system prevent-host-death family antitoxin [Leucobacter insecticola]